MFLIEYYAKSNEADKSNNDWVTSTLVVWAITWLMGQVCDLVSDWWFDDYGNGYKFCQKSETKLTKIWECRPIILH